MTRRAGWALAATALAAAGVLVATAEEGREHPPAVVARSRSTLEPVVWRELVFKAQKFLLSATASLRVELAPSAGVGGLLREPGVERLVEPDGAELAVVTLSTKMPFAGRETATVLVDPTTGEALQSEKTHLGKSYWKLLRYAAAGFYVWRAEAEGRGERSLDDPTRWSRRKQAFVAWQGEPPEGTVVTDSYALLYLVSAARLDRDGSALVVCLPTKGRLVELRFSGGAMVTRRVRMVEEWAGGRRRRDGQLEVRAVHGEARALTGDNGSEVETGLLGMRGELTVYVETGTGIPIEVEGRTKEVGRLRVRLRRMVLASPPEAEQGEQR